MMSRQAYFYRVPPQELHRRNQLQADPAKNRALQTVIDMKVWVVANVVCIVVLDLFHKCQSYFYYISFVILCEK